MKQLFLVLLLSVLSLFGDVEIQKGWNLISIPTQTNRSFDLNTLLENKATIAWKFTTSNTGEYAWEQWSPGKSMSVENGDGLFVGVSSGTYQLDFNTSSIENSIGKEKGYFNAPTYLKNKWYLLGFGYDISIAEIKNIYPSSVIWIMKNGYYQQLNDPQTIIKAGEGFWFKNKGEKNALFSQTSIIEKHYIDISAVQRFSKFRSSEGHDYSDSYESCRSMKHYFVPNEGTDWSKINIYTPMSGTIKEIRSEWAGNQLIIQSSKMPSIEVVIFHVNSLSSLSVGTALNAGDLLGTHIGAQTYSDIAIREYHTDGKMQLLSYFSLMDPSLLNDYMQRFAMTQKEDTIISKELRDTYALTCTGETFTNTTNAALNNWILKK